VRVLTVVHQRDAGPGVFADAIAARAGALGEWYPAEGEPVPADLHRYDAVMTLGGAMHADQEDRHPWLAVEKEAIAELLEAGTPVLGVCLGSQLLGEAAGGRARRGGRPEIGWHEVELAPAGTEDPVLGGLPGRFEAFQWHSYEVSIPTGAVALAHSPVCLQAFRVDDFAWGIQFHAEVGAADAEQWIRDYRSDEDAIRLGLDAEALSAETAGKIGAWNALGRSLCDRFLATVAA
jgi:GMP synthase (glutamine-hydrolysing)